jgi:hypothetical protein
MENADRQVWVDSAPWVVIRERLEDSPKPSMVRNQPAYESIRPKADDQGIRAYVQCLFPHLVAQFS